MIVDYTRQAVEKLATYRAEFIDEQIARLDPGPDDTLRITEHLNPLEVVRDPQSLATLVRLVYPLVEIVSVYKEPIPCPLK